MAEFEQAREQMASWLRRADDPWGISWRVANFIRRADARRAWRFTRALVGGARYDRPIFVIGAPRSGTTTLFRVLQASPSLGSLPGEGHDIWRTYHHPRSSGWSSDRVGAGSLGLLEARVVKARLRAWFPESRFVEKTPENSLRIPYLLDLFPDARFVVIHRNPADVVNSLINGWRDPTGRYRSYYVPQELHIEGYAHRRRWCFALVEGWRELGRAAIPDIAVEQWQQCVRGVVEGRQLVPEDRWQEIHLEQLIADPDRILGKVCRGIEVEVEPDMSRRLAELLTKPVNALSAPAQNKWRDQNAAEIQERLDRLEPLATTIGYRRVPEGFVLASDDLQPEVPPVTSP